MTPGPKLLDAAFAVAAYVTALAGAYLLIGRLSRLVLWAQTFEGCRACHLLGQIPWGPPYWLLRAHLRQIGQSVPDGERELL